jgi:phosphohistidine swiveling domain-containing protein
MLTFLWKEYYIDYLWATQVTAPSYFQVEGYLMYGKGSLFAYATEKELNASKREAQRVLLNPRLTESIRNQTMNLLQTVQDSHYLFNSLQSVSNSGLLSRFFMVFEWMREFMSLYRYSEAHYAVVLEEMLTERLHEYFPDEDIEHFKIQLLADEYTDAVPREIEDLVSAIHTLAQDRFTYKQIDRYVNEFAENLLIETAKRFPIAVSQISHLSVEELTELLQNVRFPDLSHSNKRHHFFLLKVHEEGFEEILDPQEIQEFYSLLPQSTTTLSGMVAYPGEVGGRVRIAEGLNTAEDYRHFIETFREGDILVAPMTVPDLSPLFSVSSAVITDEGGITSHAALLAREYKTPCMVGTQRATSTLQDGDWVSVSSSTKTVTKQ